MDDISLAVLQAALRMTATARRPEGRVTTEPKDTDWDDVRACEDKLRGDLLALAFNPQTHYPLGDCWFFMRVEYMLYTLPYYSINCILFQDTDLIDKVLAGLCGIKDRTSLREQIDKWHAKPLLIALCYYAADQGGLRKEIAQMEEILEAC